MIKELNHTIEKEGKTRDEKHTENKRKEIKTIWCSNSKTKLDYFQSSSALDTHIYIYFSGVIFIFYEQVKKEKIFLY
jgi:hypothetical protein